MSPPFALRAKDIAKRYRLGARIDPNPTLRDSLVSVARRLLDFGSQATPAPELWALDGVSFEIGSGEVVGIVGRNGAGKSTLLKILSRITEPTRGRIEVYGRVGSLLEVGTGFHPELSGRENIFLNGSILGMRRREIAARFDEIVDFAELEGFLDTPVKRYSSGMYVRLAFAVAAHLEPEILLIDEVLAVGDAAFQKKCLGKMSEIAQGGRTVLFVSHNTAAMQHLCRRGILLDGGRVVADGPMEGVLETYLRGLRIAAPWDLTGWTDRQGAGRVRFTGVRFEDGAGAPISQGVSGRPLTIALDYVTTEGVTPPAERHWPNCRVSVAISDRLGQTLFNCSSELVIRDPIDLPGAGTLRCHIPHLPLSQNQYLLTLFLEVNRQVEDWLLHAIELEVVDGDFYGTGRLYPDGWRGKGVLVPHQWMTP
ncbi:MAG: ABC transporter ATP-binding protein [Blastocatellia bacterium]